MVVEKLQFLNMIKSTAVVLPIGKILIFTETAARNEFLWMGD